MIYLDNAATSFYKPKQVKDAVLEALENYTANSGRGAYKVARETALKIFDARENCKRLFGDSFDCIFTSGCSSALNLAIMGSVKRNCHIITTYLEHNSVLRVLEHLRLQNIATYTVLKDFSEQNIIANIKPNTSMIVTTHISNVTGERIDIELFSKIAKKFNLTYILDTAQGAGHILDNFELADIVCFAGHKGLGGIAGAGGLMIKKGLNLNPISFGGTGTDSISLIQPNAIPEGFEVGTLPIIPIISLNEGVNHFLENSEKIIKTEYEIGNYLAEQLGLLSFVKTYFNKDNCYGVYSFNVENFDSGLICDMLSENYDICLRSGLHCAPLVHKVKGTEKQGMVRASISYNTTKEDIDTLILALKQIYAILKK